MDVAGGDEEVSAAVGGESGSPTTTTAVAHHGVDVREVSGRKKLAWGSAMIAKLLHSTMWWCGVQEQASA